MTPQSSVMAGELGDIFWDLPTWITYAPGYDLGCSIYVANPTETEKEYALIGRLSQDSTLISEEALPVFGTTWFKVEPGDFVVLHGALRFDESDADLVVLLIERETEQATDSVATRLVSPTTAGFPPWPGTPGATGFDWSSMLGMLLPLMMFGLVGIMLVSASRPQKEKVEVAPPVREGKKLLPPGRGE
jgi:hypothetical protein